MKIKYLIISLFAISLFACGEHNSKEKTEEETVDVEEAQLERNQKITEIVLENNGIKVYSITSEEMDESAALDLKDPIGEPLKPGKVNFDFVVRKYQLKQQSGGEKAEELANSDKGQHIHFIHNNSPYQAKYEPSFEAELMDGNNVILAFLSKSYHESMKTNSAYFFKNFYVGKGKSDFDESAQHLFYSRPKGEYELGNANKLLFDFYLINSELSEKGNKVKLSINGTEFMIPEWKAYFVEGLGTGNHTFRIQLVDANGDLIEGPFNDSGDRTITIKEQSS